MAKKYFQFPFRSGLYSKQAHVSIPEGTYEEEIGREGFFGPVTHLYRKNAPTNWESIDGDCRPQAFDLNKITLPKKFDQHPLLQNKSCLISMIHSLGDDPTYVRNADGDEIQFVHEGSGVVESDFGTLSFSAGDYIYLPRASTYRFLSKTPSRRLCIETRNGIFAQPDRGLMGQHALYDPAVLSLPDMGPSTAGPTDAAKGLWQIRIKRADRFTTLSYRFNPLDVLGLKGDLSVFGLAVKDIRPVMSHRAHLAPSVHTTFVADRFVICTFVPRPLEEDEGAQRVPFFHRNVDFDEVIFYHAGDFFSRDNIRPGWMTFHPTGIHHGPHPKALANQFKKEKTDEYAVMIDTREPLEVLRAGALSGCEWSDYWKSWQTK